MSHHNEFYKQLQQFGINSLADSPVLAYNLITNRNQAKTYYYYKIRSATMSKKNIREQFSNEIRRRHKDNIVSELRTSLYEDYERDICKINQNWRLFLQSQSTVVAAEAVWNFRHIQGNDFKGLTLLVNERLCASNLLNVLFVTLCIEVYTLQTTQFFTKTLESKDFTGLEEAQSCTQLTAQDQICMDYYTKYLSKLPLAQKTQVSLVKKVRKFFVDYWNANVDSDSVNYKLSALMTERLLHFSYCLVDLRSLIAGVVSVLIDKDSSWQSYYLVRLILTCDINLGLNVLHHPHFPEFICNGLKDSTANCTIQIAGIISSRSEYSKNQVNYLQVLKKMYRLFMDTENKIVEGSILDGLYNFAFSGLDQITEFFLEIEYQEMYLKTAPQNIFNFLDFCLSALFNYPVLRIYDKIFHSKSLRLIELSCEYIFMDSRQKTWEFARDMAQTLEELIKARIDVRRLDKGIDLIVEKLSQLEWVGQFQEKERIISDFEQLIKEVNKNCE